MSDPEDTSTQVELERRDRRIAELEQALAASEQRERELRENGLRLRGMFLDSDEGGWDWNLITGESYLSDSWYKILGYTHSEVRSGFETWSELLHPDDVANVNAALTDYIEGRSTRYDIEYRMMHKSGRVIWMRSRGKVVTRDAEGRATRVMGTISEVTRRREAEDKLRRNEALLTAVINNSPAAIHVRDRDYRFILGNKRQAAVIGLPLEEFLGKADYEVFPPDVIATFRSTDRVALESEEPITVEETIVEQGEPHTYLTTKFPLYDENGKIFALGGISSDITFRKRAEEERARLQDRMIEAQRLALRELSTPLIPIADDVVVMPLIGTIDSQRAHQFMEALLNGVGAHRAGTVIIDITGVQVVDTHVANALVRASRAVGLLGAQVVLTGIRPEVARTLAQMGSELSGIVIYGTLQSGIVYAMGRSDGANEPRRGGAAQGRGPLR